jgi:hypothetical protein
MAFNKNPAVLQGAGGSFRQKANSYSHHKDQQRQRGGGGAPFFVNQYKPSMSGTDTIRLIEGHYKVKEVVGEGDQAQVRETELPFYPWTEHFDGRNMKSCVCSGGPFAGNKKKSDPCHGCEIHFGTRVADAQGKKKSERMSRRDMYAFSVLDYGRYHKMQQVDQQTGQVKRNNEGEPYWNWVKCDGVGCDGCKSQAESASGQTRHWSMGWGHYQTLLAADETVGMSCVNCGGYETIEGIAWVCPHCGEAPIDLRTTSLKAEQVKETVLKEFHCSCGYYGFLNEVIQCRNCTPAGGAARRATIFDVDMQVKRIETSSGQGKQTSLMIVRTSPPQAIGKAFEALGKPLPLEKTYAPTPLETQAQQFGVTTSNRQPRTAADIASNAPQQGQPSMEAHPQQGQQMAPPPSFGPPQGGGFPQPSQQPGYPPFPGVSQQQPVSSPPGGGFPQQQLAWPQQQPQMAPSAAQAPSPWGLPAPK